MNVKIFDFHETKMLFLVQKSRNKDKFEAIGTAQ